MPSGFQFFKRHVILGSADGALTDFQIRVTCNKGSGADSGENVYLGPNVQDDFDDVRFMSADGLTGLAYWKDQSTLSSGVSCSFWLKVPSIPASPESVAIRVYYGKSDAADASDIKATMLGGEDFTTIRRAALVITTGPAWMTDINKTADGDLVGIIWSSDTNAHTLYKSTDGGRSWSSVSTVYSSSSSRSHSYLDTDHASGTYKVYVTTKSTAGSAVYFKKSTDSGATWGSEVTVASGLTAVNDPAIIYNGGDLLCFFKITDGSNFKIVCYRSTDDGSSWSLYSTPYTVASSGLATLEDVAAVVTGTGRILLAWEKETTEKGEAQCDYTYSDDDGATWASSATIVNNGAGVDDEGGSFAIAGNGDIWYVFGSNTAGGSSYLGQQTYVCVSDDDGDTWGAAAMLNESKGAVENTAVFNSDGDLVLVGTRQYDPSTGTSSTYLLTCTVIPSGADDLSDRSVTQADGIAYVARFGSGSEDNGLWVEEWVPTTARGFATLDDYSGGDARIEALLRAPSPVTEVDLRTIFRFSSLNEHYMVSVLGAGTNQVIWYKRVSGTYTSLHTASYTPSLNTDYRVVITVRGTNPTTLTVTVNGSTTLNSVTETTTTQASGKIGISAGNVTARRATFCKHIFARKYTANEPTHGEWSEQVRAPLVSARFHAGSVGALGHSHIGL